MSVDARDATPLFVTEYWQPSTCLRERADCRWDYAEQASKSCSPTSIRSTRSGRIGTISLATRRKACFQSDLMAPPRARAKRTAPRLDSKSSRAGNRSLRTSSATCVGGDIREALPDRWLRRWLKRRHACVDLLVAGPPCQGFSCAGKACPDDERNLLVHEAIRVISVVQPRIAILENVPGMLERHADLIHEIGVRLSRCSKNRPGYYVYAELVHGEPLGVPQTRRRLLLVGVRRDLVDPGARERLPQLLFPVACPTEPTDRRSAPGTGGSGGVFTYRQGDPRRSCKRTATLRNRKRAGPSCIVEMGSRGRSGFLREVRALQSQYLDGGIMGSADKAKLVEYFNHEASSHTPQRGSETPTSSSGCDELARSTKAPV